RDWSSDVCSSDLRIHGNAGHWLATSSRATPWPETATDSCALTSPPRARLRVWRGVRRRSSPSRVARYSVRRLPCTQRQSRALESSTSSQWVCPELTYSWRRSSGGTRTLVLSASPTLGHVAV